MDPTHTPASNQPAAAAPSHADILPYATPQPRRSGHYSRLWSRISACLMILWLVYVAITGVNIWAPRPLVLILITLPPIALICAFISKKGVAEDTAARRHSSIAMLLSSVGCIVLLTVLFSPAQGGRAYERANKAKCASNLRQIGKAILMYANDHQSQFPPNFELLITALSLEDDTAIFVCPSSNDDKATGATPQQVVQTFKSQPGHCSFICVGTGLTTAATARHVIAHEPLSNHGKHGIHVLFADGHVEWLDAKVAIHMLSELQAGRNPPRPAQ